jgi:hypothetical protein
MSEPHAPVEHLELAEEYVARIEAHIARLAHGHDPLGHLFGIERLARAARAEWREQQRQVEHDRRGRR